MDGTNRQIIDRKMDGKTEGRMDGWTGQTGGWQTEQNGWMDGWDRQIIDRKMDGQTDGWKNIYRWMDVHTMDRDG